MNPLFQSFRNFLKSLSLNQLFFIKGAQNAQKTADNEGSKYMVLPKLVFIPFRKRGSQLVQNCVDSMSTDILYDVF